MGIVHSVSALASYTNMVIGFLGKGGSGKSTLSSLFTEHLLNDPAKKVLAVDADHNMDLLFRLGAKDLPSYLGNAMPDLLSYCGTEKEGSYRSVFSNPDQMPHFSLSPLDAFSAKYAHPIRERLYGMAGGPHTEDVLHDKACSHVLSTPLKVYLPFLSLNNDEYVVVDEKAGSDGVGTGIASGFDYAFVVLEPTPYGIKAAHQIADLLEWFDTPYDFVINKVFDGEDIENATRSLRKKPIGSIHMDKRIARDSVGVSPPTQETFDKMLQRATSVQSNRKERSINKFKRNEAK